MSRPRLGLKVNNETHRLLLCRVQTSLSRLVTTDFKYTRLSHAACDYVNRAVYNPIYNMRLEGAVSGHMHSTKSR